MNAAILIVLATVAGVYAATRFENDSVARTRGMWVRTSAYWFFTVVIAFEMAAGGLWDLLRIEYVRVVMTHLGYPLYVLDIIGVWKIPCAFALLVPGFPRLKEWGYAGAVFNYTGAAASHLLSGDGAAKWAPPLVFALIALASWALRPAGRRLPGVAMEKRAVTWATPLVIAGAMLVVAFFTLPQGAPPQ